MSALVIFLIFALLVVGVLYFITESDNKQLRTAINVAISDLEKVKTKQDVKKVKNYLLCV